MSVDLTGGVVLQVDRSKRSNRIVQIMYDSSEVKHTDEVLER